MKTNLIEHHQKQFNELPTYYYFSPGRVNLIGEHTDYSGGYVLPLSINLGIYAAVTIRDDNEIYVYSSDFMKLGICKANKPYYYEKSRSFMNYVEGILSVLETANININHGFNITLVSTLPKSSGLSSSAALEVLILTLLNDLCELGLSKFDIVHYTKKAENEYIGVSSGIMDQFSITFGKKNHALLLDTETLAFQLIPIDLENYTLILMNTNKSRDLVDSSYNDRFNSVEQAKIFFKKPLGKIDYSTLETKETSMDNTTWKRLKHVVTENERTLVAKKALLENNYDLLGSLMVDSHQSLKNDFEVSCEELDFLVNQNLNIGALGARMTGAGFGGTMLALYNSNSIPSFDSIKVAYSTLFNLKIDIYTVVGEDGAKRLGGNF